MNADNLDQLIKNFNLSTHQKKIVDSNKDNILVIACPGSGKTHTLIARYINMLLKNDLKPEETIMITFTKKAGVEMLNRLEKVIPNKIPYHVGTIHGLSYKILKEYNNLKNIIIDEQDVKKYLNDIINTQNLENYEIIKLKIQNIIDQSSITFPFEMKTVLKKNNLEKYSKEFNLIYKLYKQKKKKENLMDFNDLMIMLNNFLLDKKSTDFKKKIKYIFFDEYQDVNSIQNNILLKLLEESKVMVVGDDAQSIYSFRGSSVKYILNYNLGKPHKMYLLEENYRSTSSIVNYCQEIISHNLNQINKNIKSMNPDKCFKPDLHSFKTVKEQYEWIANDIIQKTNEGIKLSEIAILSRNNNSLNNIELYLITKNISVSKHLGLTLLDKSHIKDFIAFIIILINPKSSLHWKRIICLHPYYDELKANKLLEESLLEKDLPDLYNTIIQIKKIKKDVDKIKLIINYMEHFWSNENKNDINNLLCYLKNYSLEEFINNLYLNQEVNPNSDEMLYLSTIHGAKGLEWNYVYIIDMNSRNFPFIRPKYYLDELEEMDEERRLFYVASSRAKQKLIITFHNNISPLLREINPLLYNYHNITINKIKPTFDISIDVKNYLNFIGYSDISNILGNIVNKKSIINKNLSILNNLNSSIISNFITYLISKIIQTNYPTKIKKFGFNKNLNNKIYLDYLNPEISWKDSLSNIFYLSSEIDTPENKDYLTNDTTFDHYLKLEKGICKIIDKINPKEIYTNYIVSHGSVTSIIDILCDQTLIDIHINLELNNIVTIYNISQLLLSVYLLKKNNIIINNIILYDPINGEINDLDITNIDIVHFKKIIYN